MGRRGVELPVRITDEWEADCRLRRTGADAGRSAAQCAGSNMGASSSAPASTVPNSSRAARIDGLAGAGFDAEAGCRGDDVPGTRRAPSDLALEGRFKIASSEKAGVAESRASFARESSVLAAPGVFSNGCMLSKSFRNERSTCRARGRRGEIRPVGQGDVQRERRVRRVAHRRGWRRCRSRVRRAADGRGSRTTRLRRHSSDSGPQLRDGRVRVNLPWFEGGRQHLRPNKSSSHSCWVASC